MNRPAVALVALAWLASPAQAENVATIAARDAMGFPFAVAHSDVRVDGMAGHGSPQALASVVRAIDHAPHLRRADHSLVPPVNYRW